MKLLQKTTKVVLLLLAFASANAQIPLPEHPRPDFERAEWKNLNGDWSFEFDKNDVGLKESWAKGNKKFTKTIIVPFPWGSPLSGVNDEADIAWYQKEIIVDAAWKNKRTFITIGASDWETRVYIDGIELGKHLGGYTPFSYELTKYLKYGQKQKIVIRVDDKRRDFTLYGKQGYGNARGLWQTVYLEARGNDFVENVQFEPDIDNQKVKATIKLPSKTDKDLTAKIVIKTENQPITANVSIPKGSQSQSIEIAIPNQHLWSLEDPYLYDSEISLGDDKVKTYFGMRKVSVVNLPNTDYPYIAINNKPVYMQLTLDQSYHPEGFYTFPSDEFMKNEVLMARQIGLNGIRTHIKIDIPRKLYWADKLGVLVMADLPNFWGEPNGDARRESERTLPEMIERDFNHPSIFSWIVFNETWGLRTKVKENGKEQSKYLPETQKWVVTMVEKAKHLDKTRLVEDNSICCGAGHTVTDINSWHEYLPGWEWENHLKKITENTYEGSTHHFEAGYKQGRQPNINSECGNVWGYDGSTGDVDWSWDYHRMINTFRKYPKIAGWLYTEHHDVINEWNGYWKFDRSNKFTGLEEMVDGMSIKDFHSEIYISTGNEISKTVKAGEMVSVPTYISSMTGRTDLGNTLNLRIKTSFVDAIGLKKELGEINRKIPYTPFANGELESIVFEMPDQKGLVTAAYFLEDLAGNVLHRNVFSFIVEAPTPSEIALPNGKKAKLVSIEPKNFSDAKWSKKQWNVLDGLKVNGAGSGYFEYKIKVPGNAFESATFIAELGAKELFVKDMNQDKIKDDNYMLGAKVEPSKNPNSYPMTDETLFPSMVSISVNGVFAQKVDLPDDPADHRGVLSWHNQPKVRKLNEAGSYGYRVAVNIPKEALEKAKKTGELVIRLTADEGLAGGIAIYGDKFGRYPMNPSVIFY
ncbi:MAG: glycoside hydrolase family 2 protein [Spirosomataceae bacterium]